MNVNPVLECRGVTKLFPEVAALDDLSFSVAPGELHAVLGANGAGKTTLMKVLAGLHPVGTYQGEVLVDGQVVRLKGPEEAGRRGLGIVMRRWATFDRLSAAENIVIGRWKTSGGFLINPQDVRQQARAALAVLDVDFDLDAPMGRMSAGQKRLTMLARAVCTQPKVVVLDEPATFLTTPEATGQLLRAVRGLAKHGIACLYLTPHVLEAMAIADRLTVLRDGKSAGGFERERFDEITLTQTMASRQPGRTSGPDDDPSTSDGGLFGSLRSMFTPRK